MPWTSMGSDEYVTVQDLYDGVQEAVLDGRIQVPDNVPTFATIGDVETYIFGDGDLGSDLTYPTKGDVMAWKTDPTTTYIAPTNFAATHQTASCPDISVGLTWTHPGDAPSSGLIVEWRPSGTATWTQIGSLSQGVTSMTHSEAHATPPEVGGNNYRIRYSSRSDWMTTSVSAICPE